LPFLARLFEISFPVLHIFKKEQNMDLEKARIRAMTTVMELLSKKPPVIKRLLRTAASAPVLKSRLPVLPRAFMGLTAFELHTVDMKKGRISIGGVEEIMAGSKIIHLLHTTLAERIGEKEKDKALYQMGKTLCRWEVSQALEHGLWAPPSLAPLMINGQILEKVQTDKLMARFFRQTMNMMSRLITDEGGWGHLEFDFSGTPLKVFLHHSQEARWLGKSEKPVCSFYAGIVAGYASTISGQEFECREVSCAATGADFCTFELEKAGS
jgi:predicted hydrocarbon binding protein